METSDTAPPDTRPTATGPTATATAHPAPAGRAAPDGPDGRGGVRIGVRLAGSPELAEPAAVRRVAGAAEELGYDAVWAVGPDAADLLAALAQAAAVTDHVRLGAGLLVRAVPERDALVRTLATLGRVGGDRLTVGLGLDPALPAQSAETLLDAVVAACGRDAAPPLVLTAATPDALDLVARRADGWVADGVPVSRLAERWAALREATAAHGREVDDLLLVAPAWVSLRDEPLEGTRRDYQGDAAQVAHDVAEAAGAGAHEVVLMVAGDPTLDDLLAAYAGVAEALESGRPRR